MSCSPRCAGLALAAVLALAGILPAQPPADAGADRPDVEALRKMIREELKEEMRKQAEEEKRKKEEEAKRKEKEGEWIEVGKDLGLAASWKHGLFAETSDKAFHIHLGGRLEFDNSWFSQDDNLLLGTSPDARLRDGSLFRRARLRADGRVWEFIDFAAEVNFSNIQDVSNVDNDLVQVGSVGLRDFWLTFREVPVLGNVRAGHFKAPVGLERSTSSNAWYYME